MTGWVIHYIRTLPLLGKRFVSPSAAGHAVFHSGIYYAPCPLACPRLFVELVSGLVGRGLEAEGVRCHIHIHRHHFWGTGKGMERHGASGMGADTQMDRHSTEWHGTDPRTEWEQARRWGDME